MSFHLTFGNLSDSELLLFLNEHYIVPFSQYSHLVFQPLVRSDGQDETYNQDSQNNTYNDNFTCDYFDLDNEVLEKISTSTAPNSCLTHASLNIRSVSKHFEMFQMDITKLKYDILGLSETRPSSDIEMLYHVPSFDLSRCNRNTLGGGALLYVRNTFNATKLVNFSVMLKHLKTIFVSFLVSEINYVVGNKPIFCCRSPA